jgi:Tfp pilus assembly protein PilN
MIRINLLPVEQRRGNRLPPKVLAAAFGAALATSGAIGWFGLVYFGDLGAAEAELQQAEVKLGERGQGVAYHDQLETNKKDSALRVQTIQDIAKSRRVWSKFLDELIDVVNNNGDTERHVAWFDNIAIRNDAKGASVDMPTSVQDMDRSRLANFHEDLENAPFAKELLTKSDPGYRVEEDKVRVPPMSMQFGLQLQLTPPSGAAAPGKK